MAPAAATLVAIAQQEQLNYWNAGLAQWQCSGFVMRVFRSPGIPENTETSGFLRSFVVRSLASSHLLPSCPFASGANLGASYRAPITAA